MLGAAAKIIFGSGNRAPSLGGTDPDAQTHINRLADTSGGIDVALNDLIGGLKTDGVWGKIYAICVQHNTLSDSLFDLKGTQDSNNLAGTVWSTAGWSLSDTARMDTQVAGSSSGGLIAVNDNHLMFYMATPLNDTSAVIMGGGDANNNQLNINYGSSTASNLSYNGDDFFGNNVLLSVLTPAGFIGGTLLSLTSIIRHNATEVSLGLGGVGNVSTGTQTIIIGNTPGGPPFGLSPAETFTAWASGGGLTSLELSNYRDRIQAYMVAMGWQA